MGWNQGTLEQDAVHVNVSHGMLITHHLHPVIDIYELDGYETASHSLS